MRFLQSCLLVLSLLWLAACSTGPSDREVKALIEPELQQVLQVLQRLEVPFASSFDVRAAVVNRAQQAGGVWLVEVELQAIAKKSSAELFANQRDLGLLMLALGSFERGQVVLDKRLFFNLKEGDRGWMLL